MKEHWVEHDQEEDGVSSKDDDSTMKTLDIIDAIVGKK
jgi:hypothetical protein